MSTVEDGLGGTSELVVVDTLKLGSVATNDVLCRDAEDALEETTTLLVDAELEEAPPGPVAKLPVEKLWLVKADVAEDAAAAPVVSIGDTVSEPDMADVEPCASLLPDGPEAEL
jgi:hypothetical protein